jgi:DNA-binding winged helix-turn-helix (wHTH) protein
MGIGQFFFAPYRLDVVNRELYRSGQKVALRPKTYAVLLHLVERAGQLIEKEELIKAVWPDSETIDTSLKVCVRELRAMFEDDKDNPRWIETRAGIGYRFLPTVTREHSVKLEIEDWRGMYARGLTMKDIVSLNFVLSGQNIDGMTPAEAGTIDQWVGVSNLNPESHVYLLADDKPAGYCHFQFVPPEFYDQIRAGQVDDADITCDRVIYPVEPGTYDIYVICFLIDQRIRGISATRLLYEALINRVIDLRAKGIVIDRVLANAFTPEGVGLCRSFGLRKVGPHKRDGVIYEGRLSDHPRFS